MAEILRAQREIALLEVSEAGMRMFRAWVTYLCPLGTLSADGLTECRLSQCTGSVRPMWSWPVLKLTLHAQLAHDACVGK